MSSSFEETSDFEKLATALSTLSGLFGSLDNFLDAFGLSHMPQAQRYGILFGFVVFCCTIMSVMILLTWGGSFKRMAKQSQYGGMPPPDAANIAVQPAGRAMLYEHYLEGRDRMLQVNYPKPVTTTQKTKLAQMILNLPIRFGNVSEFVHGARSSEKQPKEKKVVSDQYIPEGYEEDYKAAYFKCVERPFGTNLAGRPECRFESYARAFAGTGRHVTSDYRRSYSRLYETLSCSTHDNDDKYRAWYSEHPEDLVGRRARLEPLDVDRHAQNLYDFTCGDAYLENKPFDPQQIWGFFNYGPFKTKEELMASPVFQRLPTEASFAIRENVTDRFIGVITLAKDDPQNLTIELQPPILMPSCVESLEAVEGCYLVMDKLFALGYRRIQFITDSYDSVNKRMAARLGFTKEAEIPKHMVVKNANRDSNIYGMLNTDWKKGVRAFLYKKLHGEKLLKKDVANNKKEGVMEEQTKKLAEMKVLEAEYAKRKKEASEAKKK